MRSRRVLIVVLLLFAFGTYGMAAGVMESIIVYRNQAKITVNQKPLTADNFLYDGRIYAPLEKVMEALNAQLDWDEESKTYAISVVPPGASTLTYPEAVNALNPKLDLEALKLGNREIDAYKLEQGNQQVAIQLSVEEKTITLKHASWLNYNTSYTLKLFLNDGSRQIVSFKTGDVPKIKPGPTRQLLFVPADPARGFNYPYYLVIPSQASVQRNQGNKNYLFVETHNTGRVSDDLEFHIQEALKVANGNSASIAEQLGLPRIVPILVRPATLFPGGRAIYTHGLTRDAILLDRYKKEAGSYPEVFEPMDRVDLQVAAMIKHANEYLKQTGWQMEEKIFMWGFSASGGFTNYFTFLHPDLVKAAMYGGFPAIPLAETDGVNLIYPLGTYDYKEITGREFDLKAYNDVAKYGYIGSVDNNNPTLAWDIWTPEQQEIIRKVLAVKEYPDQWEVKKKLFARSGGQAQASVYVGAGHETFFKGMTQDYLNFFIANRKSDKPVYVQPSDPSTTLTDIYSKDIVTIEAEPFSYEKTTIIDAFWTGSLSELMPQRFIEWYKGTDNYEYKPDQLFVAIAEWDMTKDHNQMKERIQAVGGRLILRAEGYADIKINLGCGSVNGDGLQFYNACVENPSDMISGVKYQIVDTTGHWIISEGVEVVRPEK